MNSSDEQETKGIRVMFILEAVGRPPEHLVETLEALSKEIDEEKSVTIYEKKIHEPTTMKDHPGYFTTFAELELEVETILDLAMLLFKYMPAHLEIISPEMIALTNGGWNDILNELTRRLHGYDEIAKTIQVERSILEKQLREILDKKTKEGVGPEGSEEKIEANSDETTEKLVEEEKKDN